MPNKRISPELAEEIIDNDLSLSPELSSALAHRLANDSEFLDLLLANDDRAFVDYKLTAEQKTALIESAQRIIQRREG